MALRQRRWKSAEHLRARKAKLTGGVAWTVRRVSAKEKRSSVPETERRASAHDAHVLRTHRGVC